MGQLTHSIKNQWVSLKINGSSVAVTKTIKGKAQTDIIYIQSIIHNKNRFFFFFIMCPSFVYPAKCERACVCVCVCLCVCVKESMFGCLCGCYILRFTKATYLNRNGDLPLVPSSPSKVLVLVLDLDSSAGFSPFSDSSRKVKVTHITPLNFHSHKLVSSI